MFEINSSLDLIGVLRNSLLPLYNVENVTNQEAKSLLDALQKSPLTKKNEMQESQNDFENESFFKESTRSNVQRLSELSNGSPPRKWNKRKR